MTESDILSKLRKLKALQDRPGNEHEAAAAALKIRELLEKHNLDIGSLDLSEQQGVEMPATKPRKRPPEHWVILSAAVNELLDVKSFERGSNARGWTYYFYGLQSNVEAACETFRYLIDSVEYILGVWKDSPEGVLAFALARSERPDYRAFRAFALGRSARPDYRAFRLALGRSARPDYRAFRLGAAEAIYRTIMTSKQQYPEGHASLEVMRIGSEVAREMQVNMTFQSSRTTRPIIKAENVSSYLHGQEAAKGIDPQGGKRKRVNP